MSRIFKINTIVLILSIFISCSAQKELYTHKLPQENECIYLVDTIDFKDPIIIEYNGIRYIMESTIVKNNNNKPFDKIIKENMVSILSTDLGIYYDLPVSLYPKISELLGIDYFPKFYEENNIKLLKEDNKNRRIYYLEPVPRKYILAIINIAYYLKKHASIDSPCKIESISPINTYMRIVYPIL
jgi:hypothetical protein